MKKLLGVMVMALASMSASADLAEQLAASGRSDTDKARDEARRPAEVLAFLGIGPGMTVMDLLASGGWYTEVLSVAVGPEGTVYAQNPPMLLGFNDNAYDKAITARLADNRLPNVIRMDRDEGDTGLEPGSLDAALTALNLHDRHNFGSDEDVAILLAAVRDLLKPGGVLGVIDHYGDPDKDNTQLHRLNVATALPIIEAAGFEIESSDLLRNPDDDRTIMVFDPAIRGKTDRVLYKLTKPTVE
ncbi:MAG: SAM-dependent methyltransferase [Gammaproteobacteria bacterium]|nr:SAM-dependent methyltransferase [Gammaproteobacteria bacterium]